MPLKVKIKHAFKGSDCTTDLGESESDTESSRLIIDESKDQESQEGHVSQDEDIGPQLEATGQVKKSAQDKDSKDDSTSSPCYSPPTASVDSSSEPAEETQDSGSDSSELAIVSTYRSVADRAAILDELPCELEPIALLLLNGEFSERKQILASGRKINDRFNMLESKISQLEFYMQDLVVLLALRDIEVNPAALDKYVDQLPLPFSSHRDLHSVCDDPARWTALKIVVRSSVRDDSFINFYYQFWYRLFDKNFLPQLLLPMLTNDGFAYDYDLDSELRYGLEFRMVPRDLHDFWVEETKRRPGVRPIALQQDSIIRSHVEDINRMRRNDEWRNLLGVMDKSDPSSVLYKCAEMLLTDEHFHLEVIESEAPWSGTASALENFVEANYGRVKRAMKHKLPSASKRKAVWETIMRGPRVKAGKYIKDYVV